MAGASSHLLIFFPGGGVPEGRVVSRRLVFVSVRTIKRHHHQGLQDREANLGNRAVPEWVGQAAWAARDSGSGA